MTEERIIKFINNCQSTGHIAVIVTEKDLSDLLAVTIPTQKLKEEHHTILLLISEKKNLETIYQKIFQQALTDNIKITGKRKNKLIHSKERSNRNSIYLIPKKSQYITESFRTTYLFIDNLQDRKEQQNLLQCGIAASMSREIMKYPFIITINPAKQKKDSFSNYLISDPNQFNALVLTDKEEGRNHD